MERKPNWLGIAAVAIAGLALLVALGSAFRGGRDMFMAYGQAPQAPQAPQASQAPQAPSGGRFERGQGAVPPGWREDQGREQGPAFAQGHHGRGEGFGPGFHGRDRGGFPFGPLGMIAGLVRFLVNLAALGLLAWLLLRLYQQRQAPRAAPAGPTTPAGHDPRVE